VCGGGQHNACGRRHLPAFGRRSPTVFIRSVNLDPKGAEHWLCSVDDQSASSSSSAAAAAPPDINRFTFYGSFYHTYVHLATCDPPKGG